MPAAREVMRLVGFVTDMWSRHREGMQALAMEEDGVNAKDVQTMEQLGDQVRDLLGVLKSKGQSSSSRSLTDEQQVSP